MELNEMIKRLLSVTQLPVEQDEYTGKESAYIIFLYEDEKPVYFGDNKAVADTVYLQIQLVTPKDFNYFKFKKQIRRLLEDADFIVTSTRTLLGSVYLGTEKTRQIIFTAEYTQTREE